MSQHLHVYLSVQERLHLDNLIRRGNAPARVQTRARILLMADRSQGQKRTRQQVAEATLCCALTVIQVCRRFAVEGMEAALVEKPRPGAAPKITGDIEAKLVTLACSDPPEGQARWTLKLLSQKLVELQLVDSISEVAIYKRLKNALKPWKVKSWCIGKASARFVAKMEDVLAVYARPYNVARPVICLDEKSKELHGQIREPLPAQPGKARREDSEYIRNGTANLFLWVEPLTGRRSVRVTERRTAMDFAQQLRLLVEQDYPDVERIILVTDNLNTHTPACLYEAFAPEQARRIAERIEWHYTPEHGSWLNMAELELSVLARQCLNRRIADRATLENEAAAWERQRNAARITIDWHFYTADARNKLKRLYPIVKEQAAKVEQSG